MGLAASQARLLTITSRLSSVELRQQRIAMDKMRLANDSEAVSTKYTEALNNKTLSFSNGSNNNIPLTYSLLEEQGYTVARKSDGLVPISPTGKEKYLKIEKPTCPRPEELTKPTELSSEPVAIFTGEKLDEAKKWNMALTSFKNTYGEQPSQEAKSMTDVLKNAGTVDLGLKAHSNGNTFGVDLSQMSLTDIANPKNGTDYVVILAEDGGKVGGVPYDKAKTNFTNIATKILPALRQALGISDANASSFNSEMNKYIDEMKNKINFQDHNTHRNTNDAYNSGVTEARNGLVGNFTETYHKGSDNDGFTLNISELIRRLVQKATSMYASTSVPTGDVLNRKASANMGAKYEFKNSKGYSYSDWQKKLEETYKNANYKSLSLDEAKMILNEGYDEAVKKTSSDYTGLSDYKTKLTEYNKQYAESKQKWQEYETSLEIKKNMEDDSTQKTQGEQLYEQLKNSQFLIQGLLSGYLTLMKDGQQVSLSSATSIIEEYDKSDDAAAEAEYNTQMSKINRKEKQLDMQAKQIDTEYSALQQEYESVKSIISNHTQKDFSYFS